MSTRKEEGGTPAPSRKPRFLPVHQELILEARKEVTKSGLATADTATEKLLSASLAIATAYGALIGLVSPGNDAQPILIAVPFAFLGVAAILAILGLLRWVSPPKDSTDAELINPVEDVFVSKRHFAIASVTVLALGVLVAGFVVASVYGPAGARQAAVVTAREPDHGTDVISSACPGANGSITGEVDLATLHDPFVKVSVKVAECGDDTVELNLPAEEILSIRVTP